MDIDRFVFFFSIAFKNCIRKLYIKADNEYISIGIVKACVLSFYFEHSLISISAIRHD